MTDDDRIEAASNQLREVQSQLGVLRAQEGELKNFLHEAIVQRDGSIQAGTVKAHGKDVVKVSYSKRFNSDHAHSVLVGLGMEAVIPSLVAQDISSTLAKAVLPPAVYAQCQVAAELPSIAPVVAR